MRNCRDIGGTLPEPRVRTHTRSQEETDTEMGGAEVGRRGPRRWGAASPAEGSPPSMAVSSGWGSEFRNPDLLSASEPGWACPGPAQGPRAGQGRPRRLWKHWPQSGAHVRGGELWSTLFRTAQGKGPSARAAGGGRREGGCARGPGPGGGEGPVGFSLSPISGSVGVCVRLGGRRPEHLPSDT